MTEKRFGPVHLAVARPLGSDEYWYVISDEAAELKTLEEYGLRFDIEENFLDDTSNGFQLESSLIRSAQVPPRKRRRASSGPRVQCCKERISVGFSSEGRSSTNGSAAARTIGSSSVALPPGSQLTLDLARRGPVIRGASAML